MYWSGRLASGVHTTWLQAAPANTWGCGSEQGALDVLVLPSVTGMLSFQDYDRRSGCPAKASANSKLVARTFSVKAKSVVILRGHMLRLAAGRADLHLFVDSKRVQVAITYTRTRHWRDAGVFWTGTIAPGTHTAWLTSPSANAWGCGSLWGDVDIVVLPAVAGPSRAKSVSRSLRPALVIP